VVNGAPLASSGQADGKAADEEVTDPPGV